MSTAAVSPGEMPEVVFEPRQKKTVVLVGAGGAIGSNVVTHLGRIPSVGHVRLVDRDVYEPANLRGQAIAVTDVGKAKVRVQQRRLQEMNPNLEIEAYASPLEELPLGLYDCDLIIAALDSRKSRQLVNEIATRLGVPWIDSGVDAGGLLARLNAYEPQVEGAPCLECAWGASDYDSLEQAYPCQGVEGAAPPATNAPSALGGLAGALVALEVEKRLVGRDDRLPPGVEVMVDAAAHAQMKSHLRRAAVCRFDHEVWDIQPLDVGPGELTLGATLGLPRREADAASPGYELPEAKLSVPGHSFVACVTCASCGATREVGRLAKRLRPSDRLCSGCGEASTPTGFDQVDAITSARVSPLAASSTLQDLGLRPRDVITVTRAGVASHYEVGAPAPRNPPRGASAAGDPPATCAGRD